MRFDIYHHFALNKEEKELLMSLFTRVEALEAAKATDEAAIAALQATPASGVTAAELATLQAQVDGIRADVGVPTPPVVP